MFVWIGTSGYSYPDWVGDFYPPGTRPGQLLARYAEHFPLVELNFTFYRPPTPGMLERVADKAPPGFQFVVKAPQALSHEADESVLPGFRAAAEALQRRGSLTGVLVQLPQSSHNKAPARRWLARLGAELRELRPVVEFRHHSWAVPEVPAWLAEHGLGLVAVDAPAIPALYPSGWVTNGPRAYVRLHSRNIDAWYGGEKQRYDYNYGDEELGEWVGALRDASSSGTREALMLFNNCHRSQAAHNARRLEVLLAERAPELSVAAPPAQAPPAQRSLF
jgi:uncharacterized protein YecE (DUF72 family)